MGIELIRDFFLWCTIINMAGLLLWFVVFLLAGEFIYRIQSRWFEITEEEFNSINYKGMALYKISIFSLNLVPYISLLIIN